MAYLTTTAAVKTQLGLHGTVNGTLNDNADDDSLIGAYVAQATQIFNSEVGYTFIATNGTLELDACAPHAYGRKLFFRQPVVGVYSVVNGDGQTLTESEYRLLPANETPKYGIEIKQGSGKYWNYDTSPEAAIVIGGTLGYATEANIPADVTLAVTKLAANLYQNRDNKGEVIRFADGSSQVPADAPGIIFKVIENYSYTQIKVYA